MASASIPPNPHSRKIAIALAFTGALFNPFPLVWLHKFYLGQYLWGVIYLVLAFTYIPQVACCFEGLWYLTQSDERFAARFPLTSTFFLSGFLSKPAGLEATDSTRTDARVGARTDARVDAKSDVNQSVSRAAAAIRELEQLRGEGLVTEHEFEQKRRKLLDQV